MTPKHPTDRQHPPVRAAAGDPSSSHTPSTEPTILTVLLVNNIHCTSCVAFTKEILSFVPHIFGVDVSILAHEVRVRHGKLTTASHLVKALVDGAFEVCHATSYNESGEVISDMDTSWFSSPWLDSGRWRSSLSLHSAARLGKGPMTRRAAHIENCDACKIEEQEMLAAVSKRQASRFSGSKKRGSVEKTPFTSSSQLERGSITTDLESQRTLTNQYPEDDEKLPETPVEPEPPSDIYEARVSVGGMTCATCSNAVTDALNELDFVESAEVSLLTNSASVVYRGPKDNSAKIVEQIEDIGFEGSLDEVIAKSAPKGTFIANASIGGMTCGSCVGTIQRAIDEFPFVVNVTIDLLGASGRIEFEGRDKLDEIAQKVDDLGYEFNVISCVSAGGEGADDADSKPTTRTIQIQVDGMFCHHCPKTVLDTLSKMGDESLVVEEELTLKRPIIKVTYKPDPPRMSIRNIVAVIESANSLFKAQIYHPPTIEDRSRAMQLHERRRLLLRLLFLVIAAIPTFLIGIVFMSLVPTDNKVRKYFEEPMWAGEVSRMQWAMFLITTPVMVYGADVFHVRAFKEIRALWRPGSRVPILRRFYKFGSMNLLISAGTSVAYIASLAVLIIDATTTPHMGPKNSHSSTYFDTVVFLTMFILAGRSLEAYSKAKTGDAVSMLGKLRPSEALVVADTVGRDSSEGDLKRISVDLLEIGDTVNVPHGGSPPADGLITKPGSYKFDESSLTGESMPVSKAVGDKVFTGSVNVGGPVFIQISDIGGTSMLDQIVAVVREGQTKRAPVERVADLITGYFVPAITLIAIVTFVLWLALGLSGTLPADYMPMSQRGGWAFWALQFAIAVFVVACPCGLALAAPTALFVGGGLAAKRGILVRGGGEAFQEASRLDAIVFDKTGTLTEGGTLQVSQHEVLVTDEEEQKVAWSLAKSLEESSTHPIARAIVEFCNGKSSISSFASSMAEIPGNGMKGTFIVSIDDPSEPEKPRQVEYEAAIGNQRLLETLIGDDADNYYLFSLLAEYQSKGQSTAILLIRKVSETSKFIPAIVFATSDPVRAEAASVISELRSKHIEVYMCTGDNTRTAHAVASTLGIPLSNVMANVLPTQKADYIRQIQENKSEHKPTSTHNKRKNSTKKSIVAFVGDGTNDSPALAAADVSIAMASGSDVAVSSAGFILLNSDLGTILELCTLSRRVFNRVKWNFGWAAVYNCVLIPVAAGVFYPIVTGTTKDAMGMPVNTHWRLDPVWASLAMALSSVSVVCSSLALRVEFRKLPGRLLQRLTEKKDTNAV